MLIIINMGRIAKYITPEEKKKANSEAVKRWYAKHKAKKWDEDHVSAYSPEYHKVYYQRKKEKMIKEAQNKEEYELSLDTLLEEINKNLEENKY